MPSSPVAHGRQTDRWPDSISAQGIGAQVRLNEIAEKRRACAPRVRIGCRCDHEATSPGERGHFGEEQPPELILPEQTVPVQP
jgi:hypothetical protein